MCLLSTDESSATHKLDGWMLRFLTEHGLDINAKDMLQESLRPRGLDADLDKMMMMSSSSRAKELAVVQGRYLNFRSP